MAPRAQPAQPVTDPVAILALLRDGKYPQAVTDTFAALRTLLAQLQREDPALAALTSAAVAAFIAGITERAAERRPLLPPGYPGGLPSADEMAWAFTITLKQFSKRGDRDGR